MEIQASHLLKCERVSTLVCRHIPFETREKDTRYYQLE
jgi:hypothetical protein